MKNFAKLTLIALIIAAAPSSVSAQSSSGTWSQCVDGRAIVRCETYNCPQGDTDNDGKCTLSDTNARLTDARNDSFCANPISGCGQVRYYPSGSSASCLERAEEAGLDCDLYAVANPNFTPGATATARPTATPRATATASATPRATAASAGGNTELPKTGPEDYLPLLAVIGIGALGVFLRQRYKLA